MQTVIELPAEMYTRTEELARQKGISVQEMIVRVLAKELSSKEPRTDRKHTVELPLIHSNHPRTMDLSHFDFDDLLA
jgi:hypothetical protein